MVEFMSSLCASPQLPKWEISEHVCGRVSHLTYLSWRRIRCFIYVITPTFLSFLFFSIGALTIGASFIRSIHWLHGTYGPIRSEDETMIRWFVWWFGDTSTRKRETGGNSSYMPSIHMQVERICHDHDASILLQPSSMFVMETSAHQSNWKSSNNNNIIRKSR